MKINFEKKYEDAILPTRDSSGMVGVNLYAYIRNEKHKDTGITVNPGKSYQFGSGVCVAIPDGYVGLVFPDGTLGGSKQMHLADCVRVISPEDAKREIIIPLENGGKASQTIQQGTKIARLCIVPTLDIEVSERSA